MIHSLNSQNLAQYIDHTLLRPDARRAEIEQHCREALVHGFYSVCVPGCWVVLAYDVLQETEVKVGTVVGFPLGATDSDAKRYETEVAVDSGAAEIDVVLNIGLLKDRQDRRLLRELRDIVEAADDRIVKVILEMGYLDRDDITRACQLAWEAGTHFVKTSTGFGPRGATVEDVRLLRATVGPDFGVKAAGGIRASATAWALLKAGANRLGTSHGVSMLQESTSDSSAT